MYLTQLQDIAPSLCVEYAGLARMDPKDKKWNGECNHGNGRLEHYRVTDYMCVVMMMSALFLFFLHLCPLTNF